MSDFASIAAAFYMAAHAIDPMLCPPTIPLHPDQLPIRTPSTMMCDPKDAVRLQETLRAIGDVYDGLAKKDADIGIVCVNGDGTTSTAKGFCPPILRDRKKP